MPEPIPFPRLDSVRLQLREMAMADAPAYLSIFGDSVHMQWFGMDPVPNLEAAETAIGDFAGAHRRENPHVRWAIEAKDTGRLVGTCGLFAWNKSWRKCSVGFALARGWQGHGYMNEALACVLSWGFYAAGMNRIDAQVHPENVRSLHVLRKSGFVEEGRLRQLAYWQGRHHDMLQYSRLRSDS